MLTMQKLDQNKQYAIIFGKDDLDIPKGVDLLVSRDGKDIVDLKTQKRINILTKSNYDYITLPGTGKGFLLHRLVAMAWLGIPPFHFRLVVNHKDGNKKNNNVENLEWTTKAGNNQHAFRTKLREDIRDNKIYHVYDFDNKIFREATGLKHVSAITGLRNEIVNKILETPVITTKGKFIVLTEDRKYLINTVNDNMFMDFKGRCDVNSKNLKSVNINTGEVKFYSRMSDAAIELDIPLTNIWQQCDDPGRNTKPIKGYIFSEVIDQGAPRKYLKDKGLLKGKRVTNENKRIPLLIHDKETNVDMKFDWIGDFCDWVSKKHNRKYIHKNIQHVLTERKKLGKELAWKEFVFTYLK